MTLLYQDPVYLDHDTGQHPECAERLREVARQIQAGQWDQRCQLPTWKPASLEQLERVHLGQYLRVVERLADSGGGRIESDTMVSPKSYQVARHAAGAVVDAVRRVVRGEDTSALCLVRPPGHHALNTAAMGFCLMNNVAIGARVVIHELSIDRVLIVDWDVHHGNGTQATFWDDPQVGFFSIHRWPFYPGTGAADETGTGAALGTTRNLPVQFGTSRKDYLKQFGDQLDKFAAEMKPQLVILSAGFDSHREDPIGSLGLETEDFAQLTMTVLGIARQYSEGRLVSVLEGGYNTVVLGQCVTTHLRELLKSEK